jgi:hypothetical protein
MIQWLESVGRAGSCSRGDRRGPKEKGAQQPIYEACLPELQSSHILLSSEPAAASEKRRRRIFFLWRSRRCKLVDAIVDGTRTAQTKSAN